VHGESYDRPILPALAELTHILEVAYFAGMETDEGRNLRFMLCVAPNNQPPYRPEGAEPLECWSFDESRDFTVSELRRLAAATDVDASAIWVTFERDATASLRIQGIVSLGRSWTTARYGFSFDYRHVHADLHYDSNGFVKDPLPDQSVAIFARCDFEDAQLKLARCCSVLGRLGGTDGAVVMRSDLTVLGFGAKIVLDKASPASAAFYKPMSGDGSIQLFDSEEKGMRPWCRRIEIHKNQRNRRAIPAPTQSQVG
jgi:hypothetical protein